MYMHIRIYALIYVCFSTHIWTDIHMCASSANMRRDVRTYGFFMNANLTIFWPDIQLACDTLRYHSIRELRPHGHSVTFTIYCPADQLCSEYFCSVSKNMQKIFLCICNTQYTYACVFSMHYGQVRIRTLQKTNFIKFTWYEVNKNKYETIRRDSKVRAVSSGLICHCFYADFYSFKSSNL